MSLDIDKLSVKNIQLVCMEEIDKASSGHPGVAIGAAPILHTLFTRVMNITPNHSNWPNRDRFVLSGGHASSLLYVLLHLSGYKISVDDLKQFRQLNSITPGHPEENMTDGVDASTGPLGQGIGLACGFAIGEEYMHNKFPELIDHYVYALCGDGDLEEGITYEALSLAGHLQLKKLIVLYDSNDIQLDSPTSLTFNDNCEMKIKSMNWNYIKVQNGRDCDAIFKAITEAKKSVKPTFIEVKTIIGDGTSVQGTSQAHGSPLPHDEVLKIRKAFGGEPFDIKDLVYNQYKIVKERGDLAYKSWSKIKQSEDFVKFTKKEYILPNNFLIPYSDTYNAATRNSGGEILARLGDMDYRIIGGCADLSVSTKAKLNSGAFAANNRGARNIMYGVREHAMGACANALTLYGLKSFASTFFSFADYMKEDLRLAALGNIPTIFIYTHDSIAVGEDGPTHEPIEQLTMCRAIPNMNVIRPCDANEANQAYKIAYESRHTPTTLVLSRQALPTITKHPDVKFGAYILSSEKNNLDGILIASGSEVQLAIKAQLLLRAEGVDVRVVSMPSMYLFDKQSSVYKEKILPANVTKRLAIEMSDATHFYKYVGIKGQILAMTTFGKSAPGPEVIKSFGFSAENVSKIFKTLR